MLDLGSEDSDRYERKVVHRSDTFPQACEFNAEVQANRCILFNPLQDMFSLALAFSTRPIPSLLIQRMAAALAARWQLAQPLARKRYVTASTA